MAAPRRHRRGRPVLRLAAAAFDASENVALLLTLDGNGGSFAPPLAAVCSAIKFTLIPIAIAILYAFSGVAALAQIPCLEPRWSSAEQRARDPLWCFELRPVTDVR